VASLGETKLIVAKMAPFCNVGSVVDQAKLKFLHEAFEKALCAKLANSGSSNLANVQDCVFSTVASPWEQEGKVEEEEKHRRRRKIVGSV
jgi:hypothetical protein